MSMMGKAARELASSEAFLGAKYELKHRAPKVAEHVLNRGSRYAGREVPRMPLTREFKTGGLPSRTPGATRVGRSAPPTPRMAAPRRVLGVKVDGSPSMPRELHRVTPPRPPTSRPAPRLPVTREFKNYTGPFTPPAPRTGFNKYAHNTSQWAKGHKKLVIGAGAVALAGTAFSNNTGPGSPKGNQNQARGMYGF